MSEKTYKHLNAKQREIIEESLNASKSISQIARGIGVSPATVTREIIRNRRDDGYRQSNWRSNNRCLSRKAVLSITCVLGVTNDVRFVTVINATDSAKTSKRRPVSISAVSHMSATVVSLLATALYIVFATVQLSLRKALTKGQ
ncbi:MAG: helix-turn-helix domain-containing protein [Coriobacteriia bacterium]|nr:helix-turn-helix domain-containing protein [Coriobacteriia bacterium]